MSAAVFWLRFSFVCGRGCAGVGVLAWWCLGERVCWRGCAWGIGVQALLRLGERGTGVVARCAWVWWLRVVREGAG